MTTMGNFTPDKNNFYLSPDGQSIYAVRKNLIDDHWDGDDAVTVHRFCVAPDQTIDVTIRYLEKCDRLA